MGGRGSGGKNKLSLDEKRRRGTARADRLGPAVEISPWGDIFRKVRGAQAPGHAPKGAAAAEAEADAPDKPRAMGKLELAFEARHERDLALSLQPGGHPLGFVFDQAAGERVVAYIEKNCRHHEGEFAGKRFKLRGWQKKIIVRAFGWKLRDGKRRFRTIYIRIGRKNGKSSLAAGLGLYLLDGDGEAGAQVFSSATKRDQARIIWSTAAKMVRSSPALRKRAKLFTGSITVEATNSSFQPLSSEANTLDGLNPHGNLVDELHAHRDRSVWDVLDSAMGARRQPMTIAITTAGVTRVDGIGVELDDYATKVLEGLIEDDSFFAYVATPDEGDDIFSAVAHEKANPNIDVSISREFLAKQADKARLQAGFLNEYTVKHVNKWTQQSRRWLPMDKWEESDPVKAAPLQLHALALDREQRLKGRECRGGLDLSSKLDLTALVLEFQNKDDSVDLVCRFWIPEARVAAEAEKGRKHYAAWVRDGWLTTTPGEVVDYEFIREELKRLDKFFRIKECAYDPWNALDLATRLTGDGLTMVEVRQGYKSLSEPSKDVEAKVVQKKVRHAGDPVLRWCVSNAVVETDAAGNIKPDKASATGKIDGLVAWVMARSRGILNKPGGQKSSLLDQGGLLLG